MVVGHQCKGCGHTVSRTPKKCKQCGGSIFSKIGNWIKGAANTVYKKALQPAWEKGIKPAAKFIKDQKLVSKGLALIPDGRAQAASKIADKVGLGRKGKRMMIGMGKGKTVGPKMISM